MILHRRAHNRVHKKVEARDVYVTIETNKKISEMHRLIEKEQTIDEKDCY